MWDFYKKGICNHLLPLFIQINFPSWSMNHKNWLMNQKKSVNSIEPKRRDKLIIARDQNQSLKLQALFKRLFETSKLSSGNIPLSWLILTAHLVHWRRGRPVNFIRSHRLLKICYLAVEQPTGHRRKTDWHHCSSHTEREGLTEAISGDYSRECILFTSSSSSALHFLWISVEIWTLKLRDVRSKKVT